MAKIRATHRDIKAELEPKLKVGYCGLTALLSYREPFAYTAGVYGWNYDAYNLDGLIVCTGYRNMPGETADDIVEEFEEAAREYMSKLGSTELKREALETLIEEFREKVLARID